MEEAGREEDRSMIASLIKQNTNFTLKSVQDFLKMIKRRVESWKDSYTNPPMPVESFATVNEKISSIEQTIRGIEISGGAFEDHAVELHLKVQELDHAVDAAPALYPSPLVGCTMKPIPAK